MEAYKERYLDSFKIKERLEEKAKTNVAGITIAVSLIVGASGIFNTVYDRFSIPLIKWFVFVLFITAVLYMIIAGVLAIRVLINDNQVFLVDLETAAKGRQALSIEYNRCTRLNNFQNLIRNNSVFTSYECIRNALVCF